ncbi:TPA: helix-turn-helix transcriptional regulator [Candidatus Woesearchaeota archaeon]|nr:helix-turn-helix transcriptional regulator [Candidatus Woesearchaeota archaeon]HIG93404.1 helix-turn-helix transcriptional regulator [Candidatus Woesearchaeota archaeon]HIH13066.1 helix-turn-helix transcriptional regulator [Candidatus Woesearchaeota archaeon]
MHKSYFLKVASLIGKKWTILLLEEISLPGQKGFNAILQKLKGISPKILSQRLQELESLGAVKKETIPTKNQIKVQYQLTNSGKELFDILKSLQKLEMDSQKDFTENYSRSHKRPWPGDC